MKIIMACSMAVLFTLAITAPLPAQAEIDVNTASSMELQRIKGIGPKKAQAIIEFRHENGPFRSIQDVIRVKGIGQKTLRTMIDFGLVCNPPETGQDRKTRASADAGPTAGSFSSKDNSGQAVGSREEAPMLPDSIEWFIQAIRRLPSDAPVPAGQPGYNNYRTQKDHWLGWLDPDSGTGTYARKSAPDRGARYVYNHIREPKMLLWLISASGVRPELVKAATRDAEAVSSQGSKSAAIRKQVPWAEIAAVLLAAESAENQNPMAGDGGNDPSGQ